MTALELLQPKPFQTLHTEFAQLQFKLLGPPLKAFRKSHIIELVEKVFGLEVGTGVAASTFTLYPEKTVKFGIKLCKVENIEKNT